MKSYLDILTELITNEPTENFHLKDLIRLANEANLKFVAQEVEVNNKILPSGTPFTDEELLLMEERPAPNALWQRAFAFYNADKKNERLSMGYRPCFNKVMVYLLKIRFQK